MKRSDTEARTNIAILHKHRTSDFGVSFPDFPGCITGARALEPARPRAREGLQLCIKDMRKTGEALPSRC
ncbi:MAG: type II toxin-antitoxin system HicB family antitoxin [Alphaproteobacteria bacterium]|nr:type II toxin-antitoxin system HicB family antitoxin [Alphaproteobacteria bacterium]